MAVLAIKRLMRSRLPAMLKRNRRLCVSKPHPSLLFKSGIAYLMGACLPVTAFHEDMSLARISIAVQYIWRKHIFKYFRTLFRVTFSEAIMNI